MNCEAAPEEFESKDETLKHVVTAIRHLTVKEIKDIFSPKGPMDYFDTSDFKRNKKDEGFNYFGKEKPIFRGYSGMIKKAQRMRGRKPKELTDEELFAQLMEDYAKPPKDKSKDKSK